MPAIISLPPLSQHIKIKALHFFACPRRFAKKFQTGADARVVRETADGDSAGQFTPAVMRFKSANNGFQCQTMQKIARLCRSWWSVVHMENFACDALPWHLLPAVLCFSAI